jgi:hypothetical protein
VTSIAEALLDPQRRGTAVIPDPEDVLRPDPAPGLGYADFHAARERYRARLRADTEVTRLERLLALPAYGENPRESAQIRPI